jgi:hypothetical protein
VIYKLEPKKERKDTPESSAREELEGNNNDFQPLKKVLPVLNQDLNFLPYEEDEAELLDDETNFESSAGLKVHRV